MVDALAQMPWLSGLLIVLLGLCVGSFLNVVIYRLPQQMLANWRHECQLLLHPEQPPEPVAALSLSRPASHCPHCHTPIRWFDNVPLLGWLWLRGRCRACQAPIGVRYPLVELLTALASLAVFLVFGPTVKMLAALLMTWVLIALTGIDFDTQLLPDKLTLPLAGAGLALNTFGLFVTPVQAIWGFVIGFLVLWVVHVLFKLFTGKDGMGYGDFKLLAALGAWLGPLMLPLIILLSSVVGAVIGVVLMRVRGQSQPFAFGPYLAIAGWIALLWGPALVAGYLGLYH